MRRRGAMVLLLGVLAVPACTPSRLDPDAPVQVSGAVTRQDGRAVKDARLALARQIGPGEALLGAFAATTTLGLVCAADDPPAVCKNNARLEKTGSDGGYTFRMKGRDTQSPFGNASGFELSTALPDERDGATGPTVSAYFRIQTEDLKLPELHYWEARPRVGDDDGKVQVSWPKHAGADGGTTTYHVQFATVAGLPVWQAAASSAYEVDRRVLEDTAGHVTVAATSTTEGPHTDIRLVHRTASAAYAGTEQPPVSRGKPCRFVDVDGVAHDVTACSLTDGALGDDEPEPELECTTASPSASPRPCGFRYAVVDLEQLEQVDLVVVRGCEARCAVTISADGRNWQAAGTAADDTAIVRLARPARARYVQVEQPSSLTEVSVWPRTSEPVRARPLPDLRESAGDSGDESGSRAWWPFALAAAAAGAVFGGIGVYLVSRRRARTGA